MTQNEDVENVMEALKELEEDSTVPRNIKDKIKNTIESMENKELDVSMRIDKALQKLDEISDDTNLQSYTRTQIWNIVSLLEKV
ncbi:MAG: hypothetical protein GY861_09500 [bacterium]|nr:hypothetical protein [bacterium]